METKKIVMGVISIAVAIIVLMSMIPIFTDAGASEDTFSNVDGAYAQMVKLDDSTEYSFLWDHTKPTVATVNDEEVTLFNGTLLSSAGTFLARFGSDPTGYYIQWIPSSGLATVSYSAGTGTADLTVSISEGTATITRTPAGDGVGSESVNTVTITEGYAIASKGDYVMKSITQTAYVNSDSVIYAMGLTTIADVYSNGFYIDGTADSVEVVQYNPNPATYTISDVTVNKTAISGHEDLYGFTSVTFTATQIADNTVVKPCTYNFVIVPAEVTAERSVHASPVEATLIGLIPLLMMVGIMLTAVGLFIAKYRKN